MSRVRSELCDDVVQRLSRSKYVKSVTPKQVIFTDEFKAKFMYAYICGSSPARIFHHYHLPYRALGRQRTYMFLWNLKRRNPDLEYKRQVLRAVRHICLEKQLAVLNPVC